MPEPGPGAQATIAELRADDLALAGMPGVRDCNLKRSEMLMRGGMTWAQATVAVFVAIPGKLQPSAVSLAAWQAEITRRAALPTYSASTGE